jgi:hypothetical protein
MQCMDSVWIIIQTRKKFKNQENMNTDIEKFGFDNIAMIVL